MKTSVGALSAALKKSIRLRSRGPYRRSRCSECRARMSAERRSHPPTTSLFPSSIASLLRPLSRSCSLTPRQSGASNGVLILKSANRCIVSTLGAPSHCAECCGGIRSARLLRPMTNPLRPDAGQHQRPAGADQTPVYMDDPPGRYPDGGTDTLTSATLTLRNRSLVNGCALLTR